MHMKSNCSSTTLKWNLIVLLMIFHPNFWKQLVALCQDGCPNSSTNAWLLVNSRTPGKLPPSLQFLKFIAQVPHLNIDQSLFFQYCQSYLKKFIYHRVYSYLTEHNLIDERQYGFRENHSTELAIRTIYDGLLRNFDNKLITCSLFLDLSKPFDCCDHEILLEKLYHCGIRGVSHKLFSNFLHNRMQCTKIGGFKSSYKRISCGVPQGSVISPLLFLIYSNDITKASSFHTTLFADDINLHMSNSSFNILQTTVNLELCKIDHWLRANKLSLNCSKTNFMLLTSRKHKPASFKVIINNHNISAEDNLKYLGVLLVNKLSWKPHVQKVKTQLSRVCGILSKLKHYTTPLVLKVVYNSLIHPYLNYSILNWGRTSNATIQSLIRLQNKAIK